MFNNYLIIDMSYYMHYIIHSAFNSIKDEFQFPTDKYELYKIDLSQHDEYLEKLKEKFYSIFFYIKKQYDCEQVRPIICLDCSKKDIWRLDIFSDYKLPRREQKFEGLNKGPIFKWINQNIISKLETDHNSIILKHSRAEGDDCIAVSKTALRKLVPDSNIYIIGNDRDLLQLIDDKCFLCSLDGKLINDISMGAEKDLMFKLLFGDKSDNIPKCFEKVKGDKMFGRGFGEETCLKLLEDKQLLEEKFIQYPKSIEQLKLNRLLVEFKNIPQDIKEDICKDFLIKFRQNI